MKLLREPPAHSRGYRPEGIAASSRLNGANGESIFSEAIDFPIAVITADVMASNSREMMDCSRRYGFLIAPHGKTYMAPVLLKKHLNDGVWDLSATSNWQMRTLYSIGVN